MTRRRRKHWLAALVTISVAGLSACGGAGAPREPSDPVASQAGSTLTVRVTPSPEASPRMWTLTCQPPGGTHPAPEKACAALAEADDPFSSPSPQEICTQIYGGPQTATIEGEWRGRSVSADYGRRNGCEIHTWEMLEPVLKPAAASPGASGSPR